MTEIDLSGVRDSSTDGKTTTDDSQTTLIIEDGNVLCGDAINLLDQLPKNQFHAIVCDPPYNFDGGFMGEEWDNIGSPKEYQEWCQEWAEAALKTLKPGGHLIAFSGNTSQHRLFSGVEDAGYEIRDTLTWHYGDGFSAGSYQKIDQYLDGELEDQFDDWRYGLKPASEFATLARSPIGGSVTDAVREFHTGVLNVPSCLIGNSERYPNNVLLDEAMSMTIDAQSGVSEGSGSVVKNKDLGENSQSGDAHDGYTRPNKSAYTHSEGDSVRQYGDSGGASRFFYTSKATASEKTSDGQIENDHPTVKPIDLMEWLVKLVTAEDQWVLDPFCGSGTTLLAAQNVGRNSMGIDAEEEWVALTEQRLELNDPTSITMSQQQLDATA